CPVSDALKVFDGYSSTGVCSFRNDLLGNCMVGIRLKAPLSTRERFQFTLGVQWPFALERHRALVVRDAGVFLEARANGFVRGIGFANLGDTADGHLSGESEIIAQLAVVELLKFDLVVRLEAESFACEPIGGGVESPYGGGKLFGLIPIGQ